MVLRLDRKNRPTIAFWQESDEGGIIRLLYSNAALVGPGQRFVVTIEKALPFGDVQLQWQSVAGNIYSIQSSNDLVAWTDINDSTVAGDGSTMTFSQVALLPGAR